MVTRETMHTTQSNTVTVTSLEGSSQAAWSDASRRWSEFLGKHAQAAVPIRMAQFEENGTQGGTSFGGRRGHVDGDPSYDSRWLNVLRQAFGHVPYCLEAQNDGRTRGLLMLCDVRSRLFGRFLVSLPYVNSGGVVADEQRVAVSLIDGAARLADELDVQYLELRHQNPVEHAALTHQSTTKVHMRRPLPASSAELWSELKASVRNQIRKGQRQDFSVRWGRAELLNDFYDLFARNMRDLGTPVFGKPLFASILNEFPETTELCVVGWPKKPVAAALLLHGSEMTLVPSASSLRKYNRTNANMLMYWHLLERCVDRGQRVFDFGRSSRDSGTYRFKKQWGAQAEPAVWQYYLRRGRVDAMRPDSGRYRHFIRVWKRLPVTLTRWIGPMIVRGIP